MFTLDNILAPLSPSQFMSEYWGRAPLHLAASPDSARQNLMRWPDFNAMLDRSGMWTSQTLRMMQDGEAVAVDDYCDAAHTPHGHGLRISPAKVEAVISQGASLIANEVQGLDVSVALVAQALSKSFAAQVAANIYFSSKGVRAFNTHFDNHDVFAFQTEGEKLWNIYETQLDRPVDLPPDTDETRKWLKQMRGRVVQEVHMRPGDLLYLPRGRFHDAIAVDGPSLHVTFSVTALYGRVLFPLLESAALQFSEFREYFPSAKDDDGKRLRSHLGRLGNLMRDLIVSRDFFDEISMSQQRLTLKTTSFALPTYKPQNLLNVTGLPFPDGGTAVRLCYEWCALQRTFSLEKLQASFDFISEEDVALAIENAIDAGAVERVRP